MGCFPAWWELQPRCMVCGLVPSFKFPPAEPPWPGGCFCSHSGALGPLDVPAARMLSPRKQAGKLDSAWISSSSQTPSLSLPGTLQPQTLRCETAPSKLQMQTPHSQYSSIPSIPRDLQLLFYQPDCADSRSPLCLWCSLFFNPCEISRLGTALASHGRGHSSFLKHEQPNSSQQPHLGVSVFVLSIFFQLTSRFCAGSFEATSSRGEISAELWLESSTAPELFQQGWKGKNPSGRAQGEEPGQP